MFFICKLMFLTGIDKSEAYRKKNMPRPLNK